MLVIFYKLSPQNKKGDCNGMRAKRLIGQGGAIESSEVQFGIIEIDPGAKYPPHRHAAPEIYCA